MIEILNQELNVANSNRSKVVNYADSSGGINILFEEVLKIEDHPKIYSAVIKAISSNYSELIQKTWDFGLEYPVRFVSMSDREQKFRELPTVVIAIEEKGKDHSIFLFKNKCGGAHYDAVVGTPSVICRFLNPHEIQLSDDDSGPKQLFELVSNNTTIVINGKSLTLKSELPIYTISFPYEEEEGSERVITQIVDTRDRQYSFMAEDVIENENSPWFLQ